MNKIVKENLVEIKETMFHPMMSKTDKLRIVELILEIVYMEGHKNAIQEMRESSNKHNDK